MMKSSVISITLPCGEQYTGTMENLKNLKTMFPEKFIAPSVAKSQGANRSFTENEVAKWNKGRLFGKVYQLVIAESEVDALLNGKTDLSEFDKSFAKQVLKADTLARIEAWFNAHKLDYKEHYEAWLYKKEQDKIKEKANAKK